MAVSNPLHNNLPQVYMAAVLRSSDKTIVASYSTGVVGGKDEIRNAPNLEPGKRFSSQGPTQSIHYLCDTNGNVYAIVTTPNYSPRVAFIALEELLTEFSDYRNLVPTATNESLSKASRLVLKAVVDKYASPQTADKLTEVQGKIGAATSVMKENIQQILVNNEKIENIEEQSQALNMQAQAFQSQSTELTNKMWWKMWKMRLLIGGLIVVVLIIIIVPSVVSSQQQQDQQSTRRLRH